MGRHAAVRGGEERRAEEMDRYKRQVQAKGRGVKDTLAGGGQREREGAEKDICRSSVGQMSESQKGGREHVLQP